MMDDEWREGGREGAGGNTGGEEAGRSTMVMWSWTDIGHADGVTDGQRD